MLDLSIELRTARLEIDVPGYLVLDLPAGSPFLPLRSTTEIAALGCAAGAHSL
jgi:hypothetical protein